MDQADVLCCKKCFKIYNVSNAAEIFGIKNTTNQPYKICIACRKRIREKSENKKCEHGHYKESCKVCCTRCIHGKAASKVCLICRPNAKRSKPLIVREYKCEHSSCKYKCRLCNLCEHNKHRSLCKQCYLNNYLKQQAFSANNNSEEKSTFK